MPQDQWQEVHEQLLAKVRAPEFCRVTMTLLQILQGDFFTEYIKIGDIVMLSRGRTDVDNVFTLKDGQLTMFLDKETYERAGLVGKPYGAKGNRGLRPRWVVEFDLRSPSMLHGKPGFDRLVYACKNALTEPLTWLFCNVSNKSESWLCSFTCLPLLLHDPLFDTILQHLTPIPWKPSTRPGARRRLRLLSIPTRPCRLWHHFPESSRTLEATSCPSSQAKSMNGCRSYGSRAHASHRRTLSTPI